jgi:uncharacterized protein (TIGR03435 family)
MTITAVRRSMSLRLIAAFLVIGSNIPVVVAVQNAAGTRADAFEAASLKSNKSGPTEPVTLEFAPGGRFRAVNVTLLMLIAAAYGNPRPLPDFLIAGGPKWMDSDRFDVVATAGRDLALTPTGPPSQMFLMLQHLLADRFKLAVHKEQKELPIYALLVANNKLGPGLRKSSARCEVPGAGQGSPASPPPDARANQSPACGLKRFPGILNGTGMTMAQLTTVLAQLRGVDRIVRDQTKLEGTYDVDLKWKPEQLLPETLQPPPGAPPMPAFDPNGPSLFSGPSGAARAQA